MATGVSPTPGSGQEGGGGLRGLRLARARTRRPRHEITRRLDVSPMAAREIRQSADLKCGCPCAITHFTPSRHVPQTKENSPGPIIPYYPGSGVPTAQRQSEWTGTRYSFRLTSAL
jgi:hypothetical protein